MSAPSIGTYTDFNQFAGLRSAAERNDPKAIREVANQFEALFMQMIMKNMRDASLAEPLFGDSDQNDMYQDMMDKQLSLEMASGKGIGLADMLVRQLGGEVQEKPDKPSTFDLSNVPRFANTHGPGRLPGPVDVSAVKKPQEVSEAEGRFNRKPSPAEFVNEIWPHAKRAARRLNVAPEGLLAQAALETGWGAHVMRQNDGRSSFNLFGIKAGGDWRGDSVSKATLEFEAGVAKPQVARFRAYRNMAATFHDYSQMISENPRYASVRNHGADVEGFAKALQSAGYATDPAYADKITGVLQSDTMQKALLTLKTQGARPLQSRAGREST